MNKFSGISAEGVKIDQVHELTLYPDYFAGFTKGYVAALTREACPNYQDFMLQSDIAPLLNTLTVLDLQEPEIARYRFCGSGVIDSTGIDLTGLNLFDLVPGEGREDLYADMAAMIAHPCGNFSQHLDLYSNGQSVASESLSLPLRSKASSPPGLLVTLHASEWTFLPESKRRAMLNDGDMRIGAEWLQSVFIDIMHGTPGPTAHQRDQAGNQE